MTRMSYYAMRPTAHMTGAVFYVVVEDFINMLMRTQTRVEWFGSRTSDTIKVQCFFKNLHVELIHMVPKGHLDYVHSSCICSGERAEEVVVKVKDMSQRWGRVSVINERFNKNSKLFEQAVELFNHIRDRAQILERVATTDRLSYPHTVEKIIELFEEK